MLLNSCSKEDDFTKPENLKGTLWKCTQFHPFMEDMEYLAMKFISTTKVELSEKEIGEPVEQDGVAVYTISGNTITLISGNEKTTGVIEGETMTFSIEGIAFDFNKQ